MKIKDRMEILENNCHDGDYIDPNDVIKVIEFTQELIELVKHYADKDVWLATPNNNHVDDWYDYNNHNGYDGARQLLEKWDIK